MKNWARKSLFVLISILTFGLVTPTQLLNAVNAEGIGERDVLEVPSRGNDFTQIHEYIEESEFDREEFVRVMVNQAELQSYQKFGSKIKPAIEDEFRDVILPKIQVAIEETAAQFPKDDLKNLAITEFPGSGVSEKIFHIKNTITGKDILRFHVRRDHPPQAGYWFNFHYHTYHDEFQAHHEIGTIYWDKNTPPKWMS